MTETVLTSRRARLRVSGGWAPGRLRLSDRTVSFASADREHDLLLVIADVESVRVPRRPGAGLLLATAAGPIRLRCFAAPAVAALVGGLLAGRR